MSTLEPSKRLYNGCLLTVAFVVRESKGVDSQTIRTSVKSSPQSANTILHDICFNTFLNVQLSLPPTLSLIPLSHHHLSIETSQKILNWSNLQPIPQTKQTDRCWQITNRRSKGKVQFDIFTFQSGGKFQRWQRVEDWNKLIHQNRLQISSSAITRESTSSKVWWKDEDDLIMITVDFIG